MPVPYYRELKHTHTHTHTDTHTHTSWFLGNSHNNKHDDYTKLNKCYYYILVNIALDKPTGQIGRYGGATSDKAVDGRYDVDDGSKYYLTVCAHPDTYWDGGVPAKWWIDLEDTYSISTLTVWNTYNSSGNYMF